MKKKGIINSDLMCEIARLGHFQTFMIADMGFPIPKGVKVIDLALVRGVPSVRQVLNAVLEETVVQEIILMDKVTEANPDLERDVKKLLTAQDLNYISLDEFRERVLACNFVIRTAEDAPCSNILLVSASGVQSRVDMYNIEP